MKIPVQRQDIRLYADHRRVIASFFYSSETRARALVGQVLSLDAQEAEDLLSSVRREFALRHRSISRVFREHFERVRHLVAEQVEDPDSLPESTRLLIGAHFTNEYSIEAAALFNPSAVKAPDQHGLTEGEMRIVLSMRATGEGHISSIIFRHLVIDRDSNVRPEDTSRLVEKALIKKDRLYDKAPFRQKLLEMGTSERVVEPVMERLGDTFSYRELDDAIEDVLRHDEDLERDQPLVQEILWLADSHYEISFSPDTDISERVIFPMSEYESRGIEDARFVRFTRDDGSVNYYATYTAYDGYTILPKLISTADFITFRIMPLHGSGAQNKNLALFPRKVNGKYVMLARIDGKNNYIMTSDKLTVWEDPQLLQEPMYPWEFVQLGNCGSPLETPHGWLLVTHGVGAMRVYCLGAVLLDLDDPTRVLGRLRYPLLCPNDEERDGYVPNVVYSCGPILHNDELIVPYAMSDYASSFATVPLDLLIQRLLDNGPGEARQKESHEETAAEA